MWCVVPSNPNYEVSDQGRVRRIVAGQGAKVGRILKPYPMDKYPGVTLYSDSYPAKRYLHGLVMEAFVGRTPRGKVIHHNDNNRWNPRLKNLSFVTRGENTRLAYADGRFDLKGENRGSNVLMEPDVLKIRARYANGESQRALARAFKVSRGAICFLVTGRSWLHIGGPVVRRQVPVKTPFAAECAS
jgi:hypothetical protein